MQRSISYKMLAFFIILILSIVFVSGISYIILSQKPIYQQYTKHEEGNITSYENDELNVLVERRLYNGSIHYRVDWTDINGNRHIGACDSSKTGLWDSTIKIYAFLLSSDQLKWFEYMLKEEIS